MAIWVGGGHVGTLCYKADPLRAVRQVRLIQARPGKVCTIAAIHTLLTYDVQFPGRFHGALSQT